MDDVGFAPGMHLFQALPARDASKPLFGCCAVFGVVIGVIQLWLSDASGLFLLAMAVFIAFFCIEPITANLQAVCLSSALTMLENAGWALGTMASNSWSWSQLSVPGRQCFVLYLLCIPITVNINTKLYINRVLPSSAASSF